MLDTALQQVINKVLTTANIKKYEFVTVEHLLLAIIDTPEIKDFLIEKEVDVATLKLELQTYIEQNVAIMGNKEYITIPTGGFQRVLQRSIFQAQSNKIKQVSAFNVLSSIFAENESQAVYLLKINNVSKIDVIAEINKNNTTKIEKTKEKEQNKTKTLKWVTNLNDLAKDNKIDPLIGRSIELEQTMQTLMRRRKNNPIFVGDAGVGKTAIAYGLAYNIVKGKVPKALKDWTVYNLDVGDLIAGTKYRGEFEDRLKTILNTIKQDKNAILFIDEIHTIIGAGATGGGSMDAANLLKPALADGTLRCMGSTTLVEYRRIFAKDSALSRRFKKIDIIEPNLIDTKKILLGLKNHYQDHHKVKYTENAIDKTIELAARYITDKKFPDKAIDILDEAGSFQNLQPKSKRKTLIKEEDISQIVASITGINHELIHSEDKDILRNLEQNLGYVIFGQNKAIKTISDAIKLAKSGLGDEAKPIGSFLFVGPTGVGKTEICKQLSFLLGVKLTRFDMSEYMDRHSSSKLIGSPPGFVGYEEGGLLTEAVYKNPYSIVLLDEIEKAHPDIFNMFLQIMDNGKLTDSNGREVDFTNVMLIMTSNVGAEKMQQSVIGFNPNEQKHSYEKELNKTFAPEFRNRLSKIIYFNSLGKEHIYQVIDKFIFALEEKLTKNNISISLDNKARNYLMENGYDENMGARPMARLIEEQISMPLADEMLFGELVNAGSIVISANKNELKFKITQ
jgi:ATP-dependent Clp protease ATP-binding subunit ClpA